MTHTIDAAEYARQNAYDSGYEDGQQAARQDAGDLELSADDLDQLVKAFKDISANAAKAISILTGEAGR